MASTLHAKRALIDTYDTGIEEARHESQRRRTRLEQDTDEIEKFVDTMSGASSNSIERIADDHEWCTNLLFRQSAEFS
jgi:hypothetical protein